MRSFSEALPEHRQGEPGRAGQGRRPFSWPMNSMLLSAETYRRGALSSSALNLVAQGLGFLINVALAYYFGTQSKTDIYFYCLSVMALLSTFLTGLDSSVIIPEAMRIAEQDHPRESVAFLNCFFYVFAALALLLTLVMWVNPVRFFRVVSDFNPEILGAHAAVVGWSVPLFLLMVLSQYLTDVLTSQKYFTIPMLLSILNRLIMLGFLVALWRRLDILGAVLGMVAATAVQLALLIFLMKSLLGWDFSPRWVRPGRRVLHNILFSQAGNMATMLSSYVPLFLLSGFSAGVLTALNYGQRLAAIPVLMIMTQVSAVAGIKLNEVHARGDWEGVDRTFCRAARLLVFVLLPLSAYVFVYSREIVAVLFQRGAFDEHAVDNTAAFLGWFVLNLPFLAINTIVARLFMASQKIRQAFWYQVVMNLLLVGLTVVLLRRLGAIGYPVAQLVLGLANVLLLYWLMKYLFPAIPYGRLLKDLARMILFNSVAAACVMPVRHWTQGWPALGSAVIGFAALAALVGVGCVWPLGREFREMRSSFLRTAA